MALTKQAFETYKELFGSEPKKSLTDQQFMEILQNEIFGEVFSTGVISARERERITVICLACLQTLPQLRAHLNGALNTGNSPEVIRETIYALAPYIGYPRTLNAIGVMNEVFQERGITSLKEGTVIPYESREEEGRKIQVPLYGDEVKEVFAKLPGEFSTFVPHLLSAVGFGDFGTRGILSEKQLEMTSLIALVATNSSTQLKPHIAGAIKAGNTVEEVTASIVQALPYVGFPSALSALVLITKIDEGSTEAYR